MEKVNDVDRVYVCNAPFIMEEVAELTEAQLDKLKSEIEHFVEHEFSRSCPEWAAYEWVRYFMNKASPMEMIEAWNEFNKR